MVSLSLFSSLLNEAYASTTPKDALATGSHFEIMGFWCPAPNVKILLLDYFFPC